jgi:hypothetical protein
LTYFGIQSLPENQLASEPTAKESKEVSQANGAKHLLDKTDEAPITTLSADLEKNKLHIKDLKADNKVFDSAETGNPGAGYYSGSSTNNNKNDGNQIVNSIKPKQPKATNRTVLALSNDDGQKVKQSLNRKSSESGKSKASGSVSQMSGNLVVDNNDVSHNRQNVDNPTIVENQIQVQQKQYVKSKLDKRQSIEKGNELVQQNIAPLEKTSLIALLENRNASIPLEELQLGIPARVDIKEVPLDNPLDKPFQRKWQFFGSSGGGVAQNTINLNHSETHHQVKINKINTIQSMFFQVGGGVGYGLLPRLSVFSSMQIGVYKQKLTLENTPRNESDFNMNMEDSLNYSFAPRWDPKQEERLQQLFFGNFELGVKPLLSIKNQSGPFASVQLWTRIGSGNSTNLAEGAPFLKPENLASIGYRVGYQHQLAAKIQLEAFISSFPSAIMAGTKGILFAPKLFGVGLLWKLNR